MDFALPKLFPLSTIMPSSIAISPVKDGKPVPSTIFAFLINKSNIRLQLYTIDQEKKLKAQNLKINKQDVEIRKLKALNKKFLDLQDRLKRLESKN